MQFFRLPDFLRLVAASAIKILGAAGRDGKFLTKNWLAAQPAQGSTCIIY